MVMQTEERDGWDLVQTMPTDYQVVQDTVDALQSDMTLTEKCEAFQHFLAVMLPFDWNFAPHIDGVGTLYATYETGSMKQQLYKGRSLSLSIVVWMHDSRLKLDTRSTLYETTAYKLREQCYFQELTADILIEMLSGVLYRAKKTDDVATTSIYAESNISVLLPSGKSRAGISVRIPRSVTPDIAEAFIMSSQSFQSDWEAMRSCMKRFGAVATYCDERMAYKKETLSNGYADYRNQVRQVEFSIIPFLFEVDESV